MSVRLYKYTLGIYPERRWYHLRRGLSLIMYCPINVSVEGDCHTQNTLRDKLTIQFGVFGRNLCLRPSSFTISNVFVVDKRRRVKDPFNFILQDSLGVYYATKLTVSPYLYKFLKLWVKIKDSPKAFFFSFLVP